MHNPEDDMPVGDCCVCGEYLDHRDMGNCGTCGGVFHWGQCGEWGDGEHICSNCKDVVQRSG